MTKTRIAVTLLALLAVASAPVALAANPARGKLAFGQCYGCHAIGPHPRVKVGPPLDGIISRRWASYPGYAYSAGLRAGGKAGKIWSPATLEVWLKDPAATVPGTNMGFVGMPNPRDRADVIAYLGQFNAKGQKR